MHFYQRPAYTAAERAERRREYVRYFTILLVLAVFYAALSALTGCTRAGVASAEQRAERMAPDAAPVRTYTTADQFEAPLPADTARVAGW